MPLLYELSLFQNMVMLILYTGIAVQFLKKALKHTQGQRAYYLLATIFGLSAFNISLYMLLYEVAFISEVRFITAIPLMVVSLWYLWRNEVSSIVDSLESEDSKINKTIEKYKKRASEDRRT